MIDLKSKIHWLLLALIIVSTLPFWWLLTQNILPIWPYAAANIFGLVGSFLLVWQFVLSNRFLIKKFTDNYLHLIKLHIFLGTYGLVMVVLHPILITLPSSNWLSSILPSFATEFDRHVTAGKGALFLFFVIWISSALFRKKMKFRPWMYLHYLTYPMMAAVIIHAEEIGTYLNTYPAIKIYWLAGMGVYFVLLAYRGLSYLNFFKAEYKLTNKTKASSEINFYQFKPSNQKLLPKVGQFFFIKTSWWGEAHPFTVMKFDHKTGKLVFGIKAVGPFTNHLQKLKVGDKVWLDGPYGIFTQVAQNEAPKVIIAGGIGVTPFVELVKRFSNDNTKMFYANRKLEDAILRDEFKKELKENYIDAISREKINQPTVIEGRLDATNLKRNLDQNFLETANFLVCGSPGFMAGIFDALKELRVEESRIYSEEFSI